MATRSRPLLLGTDVQQSVLFAVGRGAARKLAYEPFGHQPQRLSGLAFTGQLRESPAQHYLLGNGHRSYAPGLRRFLSPDELSPFGQGGINSYVYCKGDPVNATDPSGRIPLFKPIIAFAAAAAIAGGALMIWGDESKHKVGLTMLIMGGVGAVVLGIGAKVKRRGLAAIAAEASTSGGSSAAMHRRRNGSLFSRRGGRVDPGIELREIDPPPSYESLFPGVFGSGVAPASRRGSSSSRANASNLALRAR